MRKSMASMSIYFQCFFIFKCYEWKYWFTALYCDFYQMYLEYTSSFLGFFSSEKCHFISGFTETQINFNFIRRKNNLIVFLVPLCSFKKIKILKEKKKKMTKDNTACYVFFLVKSQAVAVVNNLQSSSTPQKNENIFY